MSKRPTSITQIEPTIPLLPLSGALLLPQTQRPLMVFEPRYVALVSHILATTRLLGLIQPANDKHESPKETNAELRKVGCIGYLRGFEELDDGKFMIVLEGVVRFDLIKEIGDGTPYRTGQINVAPYAEDFDLEKGTDQVNREEFLSLMRAYSTFADFEFDWEGIKSLNTAQLVNMCCVLSPYGALEKQAFLEATSLNKRAQTLIALAEMEMAAAGSAEPSNSIQ